MSYFDSFSRSYLLIILDTIPEVNAVDGAVGAAPQNVSGGEAMLDLDIAYSLIYPQVVNYIPVDDEYYQTNYYYDVSRFHASNSSKEVADMTRASVTPSSTLLTAAFVLILPLARRAITTLSIPSTQTPTTPGWLTKVRLNVARCNRPKSSASAMDLERTSGLSTMKSVSVTNG